MLFPIPISTSHFSSTPGRAGSRVAALRSFSQHKRVRVVCGAAVEEDRRQIQSSTLPKRTSGTLTRQHYSTTSIHDTTPHHHHHPTLPPPTPPTPLPSTPPRLLRLSSTHLRLAHRTPLLRLSRQNSPTVAREHLETREGCLAAASATACTTQLGHTPTNRLSPTIYRLHH